MGRRSIWSDPRVIELAKQFVPATDEVWRLQNGDDPECQFFQKIANEGHYRRHKSTRQGTYICTPSGTLLGSMNSHNVDKVLRMMKECLAEYKAMNVDDRRLESTSAILPKHRWEDSYPEHGLELTMYARDLPESCQPDDEANYRWNQDRVWFSQAEARQFLPPDPNTIKKGLIYSVPDHLRNRLVRFSVIDTVNGQTSYFAKSEVAESNIEVIVDSVDGDQVKVSFKGETLAKSETSRGRDYPHGVETQLLGSAVFDLKQLMFKKWEMVALGKRWGRTVFNGRSRQQEPSPVGFVFQLTPKGAPKIAPSFLFAYEADWVKR